jgi:hypothetical protein
MSSVRGMVPLLGTVKAINFLKSITMRNSTGAPGGVPGVGVLVTNRTGAPYAAVLLNQPF